MNLENLNLVELNAQEVLHTDGGELITNYGTGGAGGCGHMNSFVYGFIAALLGY